MALPALTAESGLRSYLKQIQRFPILKQEEEYMLGKRWTDHADADAAQQLVTSHLRLVAKIAFGYRGYGLSLAEIISEGNIGLMQAVKSLNRKKVSVFPLTPCGGFALRFKNMYLRAGRS